LDEDVVVLTANDAVDISSRVFKVQSYIIFDDSEAVLADVLEEAVDVISKLAGSAIATVSVQANFGPTADLLD
jgi:hypothetical protein